MASRNRRTDERKQPTADSRTARVNFDNERESKFDKQYEKRPNTKRSSNRRQKHATGKPAGTAKTGSSGSNAIAPFLRNPIAIEATGKIATPVISGDLLSTRIDSSIPGVMQIVYDTAPLGSDKETTIQAMNDQFSFTAHANSRNYNYSPSALLVMELAGAEAFSFIALGMRVYGLMRTYDAMSRYTPDTIIRACGFNPSSVRQNYARMVGDINLLIAASRQIWIPNTMTFLNRWWKLNSEVYIDTENGRDQMYTFVPSGIRYLRISANKASYWLEFSNIFGPNFHDAPQSEFFGIVNRQLNTSETGLSWELYLQTARNAIDSLLNLQDRGMIYGDLLNAFGAANIFSLEFIDESYTTPILNDVAMLTQIMNATVSSLQPQNIVARKDAFDELYLDQEWSSVGGAAALNQAATPSSVPVLSFNKAYLNFKHIGEPSIAEVVNATRFVTLGLTGVTSVTTKAGPNAETGPIITKMDYNEDVSTLKPFVNGSEVITEIGLYHTVTPTTMRVLRVKAGGYYGTMQGPTAGDYALAERSKELLTALLEAFDWRPTRYMTMGTMGSSSDGKFTFKYCCAMTNTDQTLTESKPERLYYVPSFIGMESDSVWQLQMQNLVSLNKVCTQSLLGVPISLTLNRDVGKNMLSK